MKHKFKAKSFVLGALQWRVPQIHRRCQRRAENRMDAGAPQRQPLPRQAAQPACCCANAVRQRQTRWPPRSVERRRPGLGATLCASIWIVSPAKAPCASPTPASCNFGAEADELHFRIQWRRCRFSSVRTKTGRPRISKTTRSGAISQLPWCRCHAIQRYD